MLSSLKRWDRYSSLHQFSAAFGQLSYQNWRDTTIFFLKSVVILKEICLQFYRMERATVQTIQHVLQVEKKFHVRYCVIRRCFRAECGADAGKSSIVTEIYVCMVVFDCTLVIVVLFCFVLIWMFVKQSYVPNFMMKHVIEPLVNLSARQLLLNLSSRDLIKYFLPCPVRWHSFRIAFHMQRCKFIFQQFTPWRAQQHYKRR